MIASLSYYLPCAGVSEAPIWPTPPLQDSPLHRVQKDEQTFGARVPIYVFDDYLKRVSWAKGRHKLHSWRNSITFQGREFGMDKRQIAFIDDQITFQEGGLGKGRRQVTPEIIELRFRITFIYVFTLVVSLNQSEIVKGFKYYSSILKLNCLLELRTFPLPKFLQFGVGNVMTHKFANAPITLCRE